MTRYAVGILLSQHVAAAAAGWPSLKTKRVTPHTLRHTNATLLRAGGAGGAEIALWLGERESVKTPTSTSKPTPRSENRPSRGSRHFGTKPGRYQPAAKLLAFHEGL